MSAKSSAKSQLPQTRITTIMKSSSDAEWISKESSHLMSKATELFIRTLAEEGYKLTNNGAILDYQHLSKVVNSEEKYEFVRDIMPKKITVAEYKRILAGQKDEGDGTTSEETGSDSSSDTSGSE